MSVTVTFTDEQAAALADHPATLRPSDPGTFWINTVKEAVAVLNEARKASTGRGVIHRDDSDRYGVEVYEGRQFIVDAEQDDKRIYEAVNLQPGDTATVRVAAFRLNDSRDPDMPDHLEAL